MLGRRTVFVVGAGASKELGLPIGEGLKPLIGDAIRVDPSQRDRFFVNEHVHSAVLSHVMAEEPSGREAVYNQFKQAAKAITDALPFALSIDQYLDAQHGNQTIRRLGKIGIASSILKAERESSIGPTLGQNRKVLGGKSGFPFDAGKTWHLKLLQLLTAGRTREDMQHIFDDVAFVVFNYDRCLEYYLTLALTRYYGEDTQATMNVLKGLKIVHPYGQVGGYRWQGEIKVPFGGEAEGLLKAVANDLLTFTESAASGVTAEVKEYVENAETLVFMGFGWLPQNVDLLRARKTAKAKRVFFTTHGISRSDSEFVDEDLEFILNKPASLGIQIDGRQRDDFEKFEEQGTCRDLMDNNWMRLTR